MGQRDAGRRTQTWGNNKLVASGYKYPFFEKLYRVLCWRINIDTLSTEGKKVEVRLEAPSNTGRFCAVDIMHLNQKSKINVYLKQRCDEGLLGVYRRCVQCITGETHLSN